MWHVYLVQCADDSIYTGITTDVPRRIAQHNAGSGAKYTRSRRPVSLLASFTALNRSEAQRLEAKIKKLRPARKRELATLIAGGAGPEEILRFTEAFKKPK